MVSNGPAALEAMGQRPFDVKAKNTGLVLLLNRIADFRFAVGMDDRAVQLSP